MTAQSDFQAAVDRVGTARGAEEDQDWALTAGGRLLMEEVLEHRIVEALDGGILPPGRSLPEDQRRPIRIWRATGMQE